MVLVEGERADGATVDHDVFDVTGGDDSATSAAAAVVDAVLGTKESALAGGHNLRAIGVTWSDHAEAAQLRDALAARSPSTSTMRTVVGVIDTPRTMSTDSSKLFAAAPGSPVRSALYTRRRLVVNRPHQHERYV
jgi:hypothetical protein